MAQSSKSNKSKQKKTTEKKRTDAKKTAEKSLFDNQHKQIMSLVGCFFALFMGAVVFIEAGGLWGMLRNLFFGLFGLTAFVFPIFILFVSIVSAIGKDSRKYKIKVTESFIIFVLLISFLQVVRADAELTYGQQISEAYSTFKDNNYSGINFGYGVFGAFFGGLPLLVTGGNKLAAGVVVVLVLLALLMLFTGTTVFKLISTFKKPAKVAADYAEEKLEDFKETYETASDDVHEKRARNAARRRKASKHKIIIDVPIDDEKPIDKGVDPIIDTSLTTDDEEEIKPIKSFEEEPPVKTIPLEELFGIKKTTEDVFLDDPFKMDSFDEDVLEDPISEEKIELPAHEETPFENEFVEEYSDDDIKEPEEVVEDIPAPAIVYELPPLDCLEKPKNSGNTGNVEELRKRGEIIVKTLQSFGVGTRIVDICQSPSVTRFELQPNPGVKISKITALSDDIAMNLAAYGVRIEAPIPNKNAVGIEVPNSEKAMVTLREILESPAFQNSKSKLNVALGRDIQGEPTCADLAKMPHLLVAGTTGSGKSVCLNTMIVSLIYNAKPDEVKLIMIDPKKVEFTVYRSIPHLLVPVVCDPRKAAGALSWAVAEMDKRYALFADVGVRNLQGYNNYALAEGLPKMPQIVIIIDELSDLMMAASNEVEDSICRLAQKARAAGMHLIVATQRPSVDVITGLIKANIPSRIAFAVKSQIDSRTIIDTQGAEKLLGNGDMLYCPVGLSKPVRVQGSYVSDEEIENVIDFVTSQGEVKYDDSVMQEIELKAAQDGKKKSSSAVDTDNMGSGGDYDDEMFPKAVEVVLDAGMASTTLLQRKLKLGYARAARIIDELSDKGIIGPFEGSKPRKVLITKEEWYEMQSGQAKIVPKQLTVDDIPVVAPDKEEKKTIEEPNYFGSVKNNEYYDVEE